MKSLRFTVDVKVNAAECIRALAWLVAAVGTILP